jgi:putative ABC transport system substrate-binding protein
VKRRDFITLLGGAAAAWPLAARAQQVSSVPRIGYLSPGSASPGLLNYYDEFRRELRELGYVEGQNIVIDYRFANGKFDRLPELAAELVQLNVDIIVSVVTQASLAAKNATRTIPIVIVSVGDPVGAGLVASLARPSANVTGNSSMTIEVIGKSLALLKQAVPKASPMAVLWNPDNVTYQGKYYARPRLRPGNWVFNSRPSGCEVPTSSTARLQRSLARAPTRCWSSLIRYSRLTRRGS